MDAEDGEDENAERARSVKPSTQTIKLQMQRRLQTQRRRTTMIMQAAQRAPMRCQSPTCRTVRTQSSSDEPRRLVAMRGAM